MTVYFYFLLTLFLLPWATEKSEWQYWQDAKKLDTEDFTMPGSDLCLNRNTCSGIQEQEHRNTCSGTQEHLFRNTGTLVQEHRNRNTGTLVQEYRNRNTGTLVQEHRNTGTLVQEHRNTCSLTALALLHQFLPVSVCSQ